ncbi:DUF427 domain-containing protein [Vreelandella sp. H-I2]
MGGSVLTDTTSDINLRELDYTPRQYCIRDELRMNLQMASNSKTHSPLEGRCHVLFILRPG